MSVYYSVFKTEEANQGLDTYLHTPVVQAETEDQNYHQITLEVVAEDSEAVEEAAVADTEGKQQQV